MLKRLNANIIVSLFASCAILAFAFYERYEASDRIRPVAFYLAAAVICLLPVVYALLRHRTCRKDDAGTGMMRA